MTTKVYSTRDADRKWYVIDAKGVILGRLSTVVADLLRGKGKTTYSPNFDGGDNVIVINASKVKLSSDNKLEGKKYYRHSGFLGGIKEETFAEAMEKYPEKVILRSVKGMLQNNKLGTEQLKRLRVYAGVDHKHTQELENIDLKENN